VIRGLVQRAHVGGISSCGRVPARFMFTAKSWEFIFLPVASVGNRGGKDGRRGGTYAAVIDLSV
jgi:hypothetical protein